MKTTQRFDWKDGYIITRQLTRSFDTMEQARRFAEGKHVTDMYVSNGRYKVEWLKVIKEG